MAIWGAVAKAGAGMLKGGAKKISANKLLGRGKKKPQKPYMEPDGLQEAVAEVMDYILINNI